MRAMTECSPVTLHARPLLQEVTLLPTDIEHSSIILKPPNYQSPEDSHDLE